MIDIFEKAKAQALNLQALDCAFLSEILRNYAEAIIANSAEILAENQKDLSLMEADNPKYDRLLLNKKRLETIAESVLNIANFPFISEEIMEECSRNNGLFIQKIRKPMGVVGIIYESRPNVTVDSIALCFKSQNICILKGSKDANFSNAILVKIFQDILQKRNISREIVTLLPATREATMQLITAKKYLDLVIPRGSQDLINFVTQNAQVPIIETGAGVVHIYLDKSANLSMAESIIFNAKTRRPSVCNSLDCLIIHRSFLQNLPQILKKLLAHGVEIFADKPSYNAILQGNLEYGNLVKIASEEHFGMEFLSLKLSIKTVENLNEAMVHIEKYSSKHSEAIITENAENANIFLKNVDSAAVYHNTSTAFTDGGEFGMIAEIGISTQKTHARGPFSISALTTYKWVVKSSGGVR